MGGTSQPWMAPQPQQAPPDQPAALTPTAQPAPPAPINLPDPGSTSDLEQRASQGPQALGQQLQQQFQPDPNVATAQRIAQTQGIAPKVNLSDGNPYSDLYNQAYTKYQAAQPAPTADRAARVRSLMQNFFSGMGESMMHEAGLVTPTAQRQQDFQNLTTLGQLAEGWENHKDLQNYHNTLTAAEQQRMQFETELQPLRLQQQRLGLQQGQQALPTVRPSMSAADMAALGVPGDLAAQYAGRSLSEADMGAIKQMAAANQKQIYDFGADGHGEGKGIWLVDKQFQPVRQLSPISETSRATGLARQQMQLQLQQMQSGQTGIDIVEGRMDPSQISPRSPQYPFVLAAANQYSQQQYGQPFDFAKAAGDYKFANNPNTRNTLNYLNSLTGPDGRSGNLGEVIRQSDAIGRTELPALNNVAAWSRLQAGSPAIASYKAAVTEVADQVAKIMQGGGSGNGTSDAKMKQAIDLFNTGFTKDQIKGVASTLQTLLQNRKTEMIGSNRYLKKEYAHQAMPGVSNVTGAGGFDWSKFPARQP
jgi:hypothetical protein